MLPEFEIFGLTMSTYGLFTAFGVIFMTIALLKLSEKTDVSYTDIIIGEISGLLGGFLGAHLLYAIVNLPHYLTYYKYIFSKDFQFVEFLDVLYHHFYGMVFYGGLIFGLIAGFIYGKIRKLNMKEFSDCFGVAVPLFHCFGRIGCFFSGCCYGIESPIGFTTDNAMIESCNGVNRFPVQLLEAGLNLALFVFLLLLFFKRKSKGSLIFIYLNIYSIIRFCDEFLRGDTYRGIWLSLSTSQWISIGLFIFSGIMLIYRKHRSEHNEINV